MRWRGPIVKKPFGVGSKTEHDAIMLATDAGEYAQRRQGGDPFADPVLDALVGAEIECERTLHGYTLIISSWSRV